MMQTELSTARAIAPKGATPGIDSLAAGITDACEGPVTAMAGRVIACLQAALADPDLLTEEQQQPVPGCYARHVLYADPHGRFTLLALVWDAGQFSPVHGHYTWCGYVVKSGELHEVAYRMDNTTGQACRGAARARREGEACFAFAGLEQIHKLGNNGQRPAVSIHVYGLDGARVSTHVNRIVDIVSQERTSQ